MHMGLFILGIATLTAGITTNYFYKLTLKNKLDRANRHHLLNKNI